jgi:hypothetical protein
MRRIWSRVTPSRSRRSSISRSSRRWFSSQRRRSSGVLFGGLFFAIIATPLETRHQRTFGGGGSPCASSQPITGLRSTPIRSISASITSPGLR